MITKSNAIDIAISLANSARIEISKTKSDQEVYAIRGVLFRGLEEIWYGVLSLKTREQFRDESKEFKVFAGIDAFKSIAWKILDSQ